MLHKIYGEKVMKHRRAMRSWVTTQELCA